MFATAKDRRLLALASACLFAFSFFAVAYLERPGLGTGHLFYLAILLLAFAGGPTTGVLGGAAAAALYASAMLLNPHTPSASVLTISTSIRLLTFVVVGFAFGWFASRNRSSLAELKALADHDHLTGLLNTRGFDDALARYAATTDGFVLLFGDIDGLKQINDTLGHAEGDRAIRKAADLLASSLRAEDVVARVGGDEFAALVPTRVVADGQERVESLERGLAEQGSPVTFGWAVYPIESEDTFELARIADKRLYDRKARTGAADSRHTIRLAAADR